MLCISNVGVPPFDFHFILRWILSRVQKISSFYLQRCSNHQKKTELGFGRTCLVPLMRRCPPLIFILFTGEFWAMCKKFRRSILNGVRFIQKDKTWKHEDRNANIPRTSNTEVPPTRLYFVLWWIPSNMQKISSLYLERCPIHPKSRTLKEENWVANILRISNARCPPSILFFIFIWFSGEFWAKRKKFRVSISNGVRFIQKDATWHERGTQSVGQGCYGADVYAGKIGGYGKRPGYWKFSSLIVINVN